MNARTKLSIGAVVACLALLGGVVFGGTAIAKKKKSNTATVTHGATPLVPATGAGPTLHYGVTNVLFNVGKKFKGKIVKADSVTFTYSLSAAAGGLDGGDHFIRLVNPKGRTVMIASPGQPTSTTIGPLTSSPNSPNGFCGSPPCPDPNDNVFGPAFVGTVGDSELALYTGTAMRGTWIAQFVQTDPVNSVSKPATLTSATLKIGGESKPAT